MLFKISISFSKSARSSFEFLTVSTVIFLFGGISFKILLKTSTIFYLLQNINYFIGLLVLLLIYRKINMEHKESKYNTITLTTLIISITSIIPSLNCLSGDINPIKYLIFTITLISIETYRLIKDNHKCREWPIYVSWLFNMFAIITIIVDVIKK